MKTPIKSFEIIKEMYEYFVKKYRNREPKLMICEEEDFDNVEMVLKNYEKDTQGVVDDYIDLNIKYCGLREQNEKKLKALDIIKRKPDAIEIITNWQIIKNKEEYDLLKEVLL